MTRELLLEKICFGACIHDCVIYGSCDCDYWQAKLNELLDEYDKHVIEQYKADTNLKDTIREIHDNVSREMYCKGIDDLTEKLKDYFVIPHDARVIEMMAEQLKEQNKWHIRSLLKRLKII